MVDFYQVFFLFDQVHSMSDFVPIFGMFSDWFYSHLRPNPSNLTTRIKKKTRLSFHLHNKYKKMNRIFFDKDIQKISSSRPVLGQYFKLFRSYGLPKRSSTLLKCSLYIGIEKMKMPSFHWNYCHFQIKKIEIPDWNHVKVFSKGFPRV